MASKFPALFDTLEGTHSPYVTHYSTDLTFLIAQKGQLGISGFGISVTTMEEVFIKVGENNTDEVAHAESGSIDDPLLAASTLTYDITDIRRLSVYNISIHHSLLYRS